MYSFLISAQEQTWINEQIWQIIQRLVTKLLVKVYESIMVWPKINDYFCNFTNVHLEAKTIPQWLPQFHTGHKQRLPELKPCACLTQGPILVSSLYRFFALCSTSPHFLVIVILGNIHKTVLNWLAEPFRYACICHVFPVFVDWRSCPCLRVDLYTVTLIKSFYVFLSYLHSSTSHFSPFLSLNFPLLSLCISDRKQLGDIIDNDLQPHIHFLS